MLSDKLSDERYFEETFHLLLVSIILVGLFSYFSWIRFSPSSRFARVRFGSFCFVRFGHFACFGDFVLASFRSFPFDGFVLRFGKFNVLTVHFRKTHSNSADLTCGFPHRAQGWLE